MGPRFRQRRRILQVLRRKTLVSLDRPNRSLIVNESSNGAYDAILLLSFGGPEGPADVIPFLENVLRGRNVPRARLEEVAKHYQHFGGVSPINQQNREIKSALETELANHGIDLPVYFGNRNWHPMLEDTMRQMQTDGVKKFLTWITSSYSCYSGCRQYRENLAAAMEAIGPDAPVPDKIRVWYNHPNWIAVNADHLDQARDELGVEADAVHVAFTAHSIPTSMAEGSAYEAQLNEAARLTAEASGITDYQLVYQSRSGRPQDPWLEPDICDHLEAVAERGVTHVIVHPIGFISDHMEILFDLDTEAKEACDELGLQMARAASAGTHPAFISMIRELIQERLDPSLEQRALGDRGPNHNVCPANCCQSGRPGPGKPASAQQPA